MTETADTTKLEPLAPAMIAGLLATTATVVTSEPVPEVVGSATSGRTGPGTGVPRPIGALM